MKLENSRCINGLLLILFFLTLVECAALTICRPKHGLSGKYYDNQEWKGTPHFTSIDTEISRNILHEQAKKLPQESYSIEWTGYIHIPKTGIYTFLTISDDGSWLFIDNNLVVDNGGSHGKKREEGQIHLLEGLHEIKIRYFQIGGFAVLEVLWENDQLPRTPLSTSILFPSTTNTASFWIYQNTRAMLPFLLGLWIVFLIGIGISSYIALRTFRSILFSTLHRCFVQPVYFAGQQLKKPQVRYWIIVVVYTLIIFLTLSYARVISTSMMDRFGEDIFSKITAVTLSIAGIGVFVYLILVTLRHQFVLRLLCFAGIIAVYVFILNQDFRDIVFSQLWFIERFIRQFVGGSSSNMLRFLPRFIRSIREFFVSLDIYPIYAGEKVHFLEYGLLGLLLCKTLSYHIKDKTAYLLAVALVYLTGMLDEGIQWALPNRVGEYRDIWINIVSGGLAVLLVWVVIRPRILQKPFKWSSLKPLCYTLAVAAILTGFFLQVVHGFGTYIFVPDSGTQFISAFPENQLVTLDTVQIKRLEGKPAEDIPKAVREKFMYEALRHHYFRDIYYKNKDFFESYCEQEILKTYFRSYMRKRSVKPIEYDTEHFTISPDPNKHIFYTSEAQELAITMFGPKTMWSVIGFIVSFFCLLATSLPVAAPRRRIERIVLRPLFGLAFLISVIIALYPTETKEEPDHTNLLILTIDSCQPDYFGAYGYPRNTTPFFDALASEGVLFSNAIASSSWTIPSLVSLVTGVNPNIHGIDVRGKLMDQSIPTLFEVLEQHGYAVGDTSYVLTEPSVKSVFKKTEISPEAALAEGRSEESYLLSWMEAHKEKPFFAWVHFHTVHLPYKATPPYNKLFAENLNPQVLKDEQIKFVRSQLIIRKGEVEFDQKRHAGVVRTLFTQALRQQDAKVGKVLMKLDELGLRDNTMIVITADHGEELLEHGFVGHASTSWDGTVYDDLIQVPLLIVYPKKLPKGKHIDTQVRVIDIMPTVLEMLEIPFSEKIQGKSFLSSINGEGDFQETAFSETTPCGYSCPTRLAEDRVRAVRTNEWKLISKYSADTGETHYEFYNLKDDPGETQNVLDLYPDIVDDYKQKLQRWMDAPDQFAYRHKKSEDQHYLDVDVEVRPIVLFPKVGTIVSHETDGKRIHLKWTGDEHAEYLIEYDIGKSGYHMVGQLEVVGTEQWYGPYPEDIWQELPKYNPWKFRIIPKQYPQYPSDWITFEMKYE